MVKIIVLPVVCILLSCFNLQDGRRNPKVLIKTGLGDITVELFADRAPVTVANFLRYVDSSLFDNSSFYRVVRSDNQPNDSVKIAVIQGGRFQDDEKGFPPIKQETTNLTGILHRNGVISMARSSPDSATSEFFICVGDQPELDYGGKRNKDGKGFAAFGKVTKGMEVVYRIHEIKAARQYLEQKVVISKISRIKD